MLRPKWVRSNYSLQDLSKEFGEDLKEGWHRRMGDFFLVVKNKKHDVWELYCFDYEIVENIKYVLNLPIF